VIPILSALLPLAGKVLDRVLPDEEAKAKAKLELLKLEQEGAFKDEENRYNAIIAEAKSSDPWTSRARPTFLYVVYLYILAAIPMGVLFWVNPEAAKAVIEGVKGWLEAIPGDMWMLMGAGYLGYSGARSFDKRKK
jgi:hypothetical protein